MPRVRSLVQSSSPLWAVVSQGCNGVSNVLLSFVVARGSTPSAFGIWSIGYIVFMLTYSITRAACSTHVLLLGRRQVSPSTRNGAVTFAAVVGLVMAIPLGVVGLASHPILDVTWPFLVFLAPLATIDVFRAIAFHGQRNSAAAVIDICWLALQALAFALLIATGANSATRSTIAWGASGTVAMLIGLRIVRVSPNLGALRQFWRESRSTSWKLVLDDLLLALRTQATPLAVIVFAGYAAAGALRAGLSLMGFLNIIILGLTPLATNFAARRTQGGGRPWPMANRWAQLLLFIAVLNGAILWSLPTSVGRELLGANWEGARSIMLALIVHSCLRGYISGAPIILRSRGHLNEALRLRARAEPVALACPVIGAMAYGVQGAAWGFALGALFTTGQSLLAIRRSAHTPANITGGSSVFSSVPD